MQIYLTPNLDVCDVTHFVFSFNAIRNWKTLQKVLRGAFIAYLCRNYNLR